MPFWVLPRPSAMSIGENCPIRMLWFMKSSASATLSLLACPGCVWGTQHCWDFPSRRYCFSQLLQAFPLSVELIVDSNLLVPRLSPQQNWDWVPLGQSFNQKEDKEPFLWLWWVMQLLGASGRYQRVEDEILAKDKILEIDPVGYHDWFYVDTEVGWFWTEFLSTRRLKNIKGKVVRFATWFCQRH